MVRDTRQISNLQVQQSTCGSNRSMTQSDSSSFHSHIHTRLIPLGLDLIIMHLSSSLTTCKPGVVYACTCGCIVSGRFCINNIKHDCMPHCRLNMCLPIATATHRASMQLDVEQTLGPKRHLGANKPACHMCCSPEYMCLHVAFKSCQYAVTNSSATCSRF